MRSPTQLPAERMGAVAAATQSWPKIAMAARPTAAREHAITPGPYCGIGLSTGCSPASKIDCLHDLVAEFVRAFAEEMAAAHRRAVGMRSQLDAQLADVERRLEGVLRAIENGAWSEALRKRLSEIEARKVLLQKERDELSEPVTAIRLHPNAADIYSAKVADLEASLNAPEIRAAASDALRALIERVVLTPDADAPDGLRVELYGDLAEILRLGDAGQTQRRAGKAPCSKPPGRGVPGGQLSVVAGARNHLCRTRFSPEPI